MNPVALYLMARNAAHDLIRANTPLNQGIAKQATLHGLSQLQIQRVVESANHEANALLQKTAQDKTFSFSLASLDGVLAALTAETSSPVVSFSKAAACVDAALAPAESFDDLLAAFPAHNTEVRAADLRGAVINLEKVALRAQALGRQVLASRVAFTEKVAEAFETVLDRSKDYVRRGGYLANIQKYAHAVDPGFTAGWDLLLGRVRDEMLKLGHPFTGELAPALELTGDRVDRPGGPLLVPMVIQIANGRHQLAGELQQLRDGISVMDRMSDRTRAIDNFMTSIRVAQRLIRDNDDVDVSICKQAAHLAELPDPKLAEYIEKSANDSSTKATIAAKGAVGAVVDRAGKASIKAVVKRGTSDWIPGAFVGPGTSAVYRSKS